MKTVIVKAKWEQGPFGEAAVIRKEVKFAK